MTAAVIDLKTACMAASTRAAHADNVDAWRVARLVLNQIARQAMAKRRGL